MRRFTETLVDFMATYVGGFLALTIAFGILLVASFFECWPLMVVTALLILLFR